MIQQNVVTVIANTPPHAAGLDFSYTFKIFETEDMGVKVRLIADGSEIELVEGTDFTVGGVGDVGGGTVTLIDAAQAWIDTGNLSDDYNMYLYFKSNVKQLTKFRDLGRNAPTRIEEALDRVTMIFQATFTGIGDLARAVKLPTTKQPSEFDPTIPSSFFDSEDNILAVNAAKDGFKVASLAGTVGASYVPGAVQSIAAGGTITIAQQARQHVRVDSIGGAVSLSNTPFGTNDANLQDGMEIVVEADDAAKVDFVQFNEQDIDYGFLGNGGIQCKFPYVLTFVYNANKKRFLLKSNGAW